MAIGAATSEHTSIATTEMRLKGDRETITNLKSSMTQHYRLISNVSEDETELGLALQEGHTCCKCGEKGYAVKDFLKKKKKYRK